MAVGHIGGRVFLVTGASVQDGEADVQDVLLKLLPREAVLRGWNPMYIPGPSRALPGQSHAFEWEFALPPLRAITEPPQLYETLPKVIPGCLGPQT